MKYLALLSLAVAGTLASSCHPNYPCCSSYNTNVVYRDSEGNWGVENNNWCMMSNQSSASGCKFESMGYRCCSHCNSIYVDQDGKWGVENNQWCGIMDNCGQGQQQQPTQSAQPTTTQNNNQPISKETTFFTNSIYSNSKYQSQVQQSMNKLSGDLKAKAEKVKYVPTAAWLAWSGATSEAREHLAAAGSNTVVFILYYIPNRDCNANASAGGARDLNDYQSFVNDLYSTFKSNSDKRIVIVVEPDTVGNMVTAQNNEKCRSAHQMHKQAIAYAVSKFGSLNNVQVYLDAAHSGWLGSMANQTAQVIRDILAQAQGGTIRGIATNISNYRPVQEEYAYQQNLASALSSMGYPGMRFIVDTGRNGRTINSSTWCNLKGTGFGERPRGNPNSSMPLLDAYMWLKPPGEADGSSQGSRADPNCATGDSLQTSPDAGSWFHEYFVQLLQNANPGF